MYIVNQCPFTKEQLDGVFDSPDDAYDIAAAYANANGFCVRKEGRGRIVCHREGFPKPKLNASTKPRVRASLRCGCTWYYTV